MTSHPRQPAGTPSGGQFTQSPRHESTIGLDRRSDVAAGPLEQYDNAIARFRDRFPGAAVTVRPSGRASDDNTVCCIIDVTFPDGRTTSSTNALGDWGHDHTSPGDHDEDLEAYGALLEAADTLMWARMHQAAATAARRMHRPHI